MQIKDHQLAHFDERPQGTAIDTIVVHSLYAEDCPTPDDPMACIDALDRHKVAAHYLIDRAGNVWRNVPEEKRAWHAGVSRMPRDGREGVNAFSIGIELIGVEGAPFTNDQYESLALLCREIVSRHPIADIVGHEHIAPGRKTDPGPLFDWKLFERRLGIPAIRFP